MYTKSLEVKRLASGRYGLAPEGRPTVARGGASRRRAKPLATLPTPICPSPGGATETAFRGFRRPSGGSVHFRIVFQGFRSLRSLHPWLPALAAPRLRPCRPHSFTTPRVQDTSRAS